MTFEVIPNEQTPKVEKSNIDDRLLRIKLTLFLAYAKTRTDAVGLAANQCSIDGERFMVRVFALRDLINKNNWRLILNPEIIGYIGMKEIKAEGCLTWKDKVIVAERSRGVMVKYYDEHGDEHIEVHKGFEGQIWQHEINHLNGVVEDVRDSFDEPNPIKVSRNDKCPCGSDKKYKHCCLLLI